VTALRAIGNFKGAVVSMPHQSRMLSLVDEATPQACEVGACNVIRREGDGRLVATMYDGEAFVAGSRRAGHEVAGRRAFLAGAGGAASAIAFALGKFGAASLTIHNRTGAKAQAPATRAQRAWPRLAVAVGGEDARGHDLVINGTSLGSARATRCRSTRARSTAAPSPRRSSSPTRRSRFSRRPENLSAPSTSASRCLRHKPT
jgi:shikimate dehydrogenase